VNWGRYAEIFDYDREHGRLVQTEPTAPAESASIANHDSANAPKS